MFNRSGLMNFDNLVISDELRNIFIKYDNELFEIYTNAENIFSEKSSLLEEFSKCLFLLALDNKNIAEEIVNYPHTVFNYYQPSPKEALIFRNLYPHLKWYFSLDPSFEKTDTEEPSDDNPHIAHNFSKQYVLDYVGLSATSAITAKWTKFQPNHSNKVIRIDKEGESLANKGIDIKPEDTVRIYIIAHGKPSAYTLQGDYKEQRFTITYEELADDLAKLISDNKNVVINLLSCGAGKGSSKNVKDDISFNSYAAKLHQLLFLKTGKNIPVVARTTKMALTYRRKVTIGINQSWEDLANNKEIKHEFKHKEPGSKVIYTANAKGQQIRLDAYSYAWKAKVIDTVYHLQHTANRKEQALLYSWIIQFKEMAPKEIAIFLARELKKATPKNTSRTIRRELNSLINQAKHIFSSPHTINDHVLTGISLFKAEKHKQKLIIPIDLKISAELRDIFKRKELLLTTVFDESDEIFKDKNNLFKEFLEVFFKLSLRNKVLAEKLTQEDNQTAQIIQSGLSEQQIREFVFRYPNLKLNHIKMDSLVAREIVEERKQLEQAITTIPVKTSPSKSVADNKLKRLATPLLIGLGIGYAVIGAGLIVGSILTGGLLAGGVVATTMLIVGTGIAACSAVILAGFCIYGLLNLGKRLFAKPTAATKITDEAERQPMLSELASSHNSNLQNSNSHNKIRNKINKPDHAQGFNAMPAKPISNQYHSNESNQTNLISSIFKRIFHDSTITNDDTYKDTKPVINVSFHKK